MHILTYLITGILIAVFFVFLYAFLKSTSGQEVELSAPEPGEPEGDGVEDEIRALRRRSTEILLLKEKKEK